MRKARGTDLRVSLPAPPSLNACYTNVKGKGRVKTEAYKSWRTAVGLKLNRYGTQALGEGSYGVSIMAPLDRRSDIDNRVKPILDALVAAGLTADDKWCDDVRIRRAATADGDFSVTVWKLEDVSDG